ncbi:protein max isoform X2 [Procambarus clarkii]|uniref:protein max isoform X2 n=1 Tax=Procambarus clarkii TaxID=6728 RepID=UPI001E6761B4|nr:protein max-like isoform X2 [Procambarus clarkii]
MSDEERDIDIESDDDESLGGGARGEFQFASQAEKRAHHNALERKRRDHIKDSFCSLRDSVPSLQGEKASRAQILKKAADYIEFMRRKNSAHQQDIDDLKKQNNLLENQIRSLEKTKYTGNFAAMTSNNALLNSKAGSLMEFDGSGSDTSDSETSNSVRRKKLKT